MATSRVAPRSIKMRMLDSGCELGGAAAGGAAALGAAPRVCPPPGNAAGGARAGGADGAAADEGPAPPSASAASSSGSRALSGSSCSERNDTSRPWMRSTFFPRSMHAWCALSMSNPSRRSTSRPSMTVIEHGRCRSASLSCALCTRPRILAVPTPRAMPEKRWSSRRIIPHASAHSGLTARESATRLCAGIPRTDSLLGPAVHERLHRLRIDLDRDANDNVGINGAGATRGTH
ncbi:hypothetical protein DFH07DRAFT_237990 [Mycena maculata]|uniref:Uncharacterized protein n=1 Tax=Mycena maculata TaxID=230809 RepID=A0AAD7JUU8_9AGAR|nr:hypothetical protein DFH07DRAFT_237990 [Mycena maculata]